MIIEVFKKFNTTHTQDRERASLTYDNLFYVTEFGILYLLKYL